MTRCKLRSVSTALQPRFETLDGRVLVKRVRGGKWQVSPRGGRSFKVGTKATALAEACRISRGR